MFSQKKTSHCKNSVGVPSTIFLVTRFSKKILESSDSRYSSIFRLKNIWYHNFFWKGPNPEEIGSPGNKANKCKKELAM